MTKVVVLDARGRRRSVSVVDAVEIEIDRSAYVDGGVEIAQANANSCAEFVGRLVSLLVDMGVMDAADVRALVSRCVDPAEAAE